MANVGNWQQKVVGDEVLIRGPHVVVGRNGQTLEMSINGVNWEVIHTFPATVGEFFPLNLPTDTYIRVNGTGQWTYATYNQMSG